MKDNLMSPFGLVIMEVIAIQAFNWSAVIIADVTLVGFLSSLSLS